jgi:RNA polymerase sigma-70 factor (ECF subfamily)
MAISKRAFEQQVLGLLGSLTGIARRLTRNDADAEDLVAETIERAWRSAASLQEEAAFKGWLFRILHNTFVSSYRRERARPSCESIDAQDEAGDDPAFSLFEQMHQPFLLWFSNPEQAFLDKLLREDLERALAALPEHHRIVVLLADVEEFNYAEIAQTLGVPVGTVRSRLARARSALQRRLWHQAQTYGLRADAAGPPPGRPEERLT